MDGELRFLIAESEPRDQQRDRRESVGKTAGETYAELLRTLAGDCRVTTVEPLLASSGSTDLGAYDAVFLTGSPLHLRHETSENRRMVEFMREVFSAGTPSFGSCAGLQIATVAAGGSVRRMPKRQEAGFGRRIVKTAPGALHPLLDRRPATYDAPSIHSDEVERLPDGAILLARSETTEVQAAEIRYGDGVFWGVQYHPELTLFEVAAALRRQASDLIEAGLARSTDDVEAHADLIDGLGRDPGCAALSWRLGVDAQVTEPTLRSIEIANFLQHVVKPRIA